MPRYEVSDESRADVVRHGARAARAIHEFELYADGYTKMVKELVDARTGQTDPESENRLAFVRRTLEQLSGVREDLVALVDDAAAAGPSGEQLRIPSMKPNVQLMDPPDPDDPRAMGVTLYVMKNRYQLQCRQAAEPLEHVVNALSQTQHAATVDLRGRLNNARHALDV